MRGVPTRGMAFEILIFMIIFLKLETFNIMGIDAYGISIYAIKEFYCLMKKFPNPLGLK